MPVARVFDDAHMIKPLPNALHEQFADDWQVVGHGVFSWSVFRVYRIALHAIGAYGDGATFALDLNYLRNVSAQQITEASVQEMQRICGIEAGVLQVWATELLEILPDVTLGDRLIGVFVPTQGVWFFDAEHSLGSIEDPLFCEAFSAIWLDPKTRATKLRAALLGEFEA